MTLQTSCWIAILDYAELRVQYCGKAAVIPETQCIQVTWSVRLVEYMLRMLCKEFGYISCVWSGWNVRYKNRSGQPRLLGRIVLEPRSNVASYGAKQRPLRPKKTCVSGQTVFPKLMRPCVFFFFFFFFCLLVRFLNRGKRSEMVSVVSRYERNEIWIEYIYFLFINSCTIVCLIPKLPYFLGKYKCYTCSIKLKPLIIWCNWRQNNIDAHGLELTRALTRDTCCFFRPKVHSTPINTISEFLKEITPIGCTSLELLNRPVFIMIIYTVCI